jgi:hypothetical protein
MLKLNPKPTFEATVKITVPGQQEPAPVKFTFKYMPKKALLEFFEKHRAEYDDEGNELKAASQDDVMLGEIITAWSGIDEPYSEKALAEFLDNYPAAAGEIIVAYNKLVLESRVKN